MPKKIKAGLTIFLRGEVVILAAKLKKPVKRSETARFGGKKRKLF